ncbi:MAG TPA: GNAT family N-acetyltransferase [Gaiellaceae bacterium]
MSIEYRPPGADEYGAFIRPIALGMGFQQTDEGAERFRKLMAPERCIAAEEDGTIVGTTAAYDFEVTVPGGPARCAGVAAVAVLPTHRRRGILRELTRRQIDGFHDRGEAIAVLWASEPQIYGRFGYGLASMSGTIRLERDRASFFDGPPEPVAGRLVDVDEALEACGTVYERLRAEVPGFLARSEDWWRMRTFRNPELQRVVFDGEDGPEGYALYTTRDIWRNMIPNGRLEVNEALAVSPAALRRVWSYLFGIDLIRTITAGFLPVDHPLVLWVAEPNRLRLRLVNSMWLRLVDVGAALGLRTYASDDPVVLEIRDAFCPWNEGRWRLEGGEAARTNDGADVALDVTGLASAFLGGFAFADLARAGRAEEVQIGGIARADAVFRTERKPWTPEIF